MTEFTDHDGGESPINPNLGWATIEVETRGGYTLKLARDRIDWEHHGKDGDVLRWRVTFPEVRPATALEKMAVIRRDVEAHFLKAVPLGQRS